MNLFGPGDAVPFQDWTRLLPGQRVLVQLVDGTRFTAKVEKKTSSSNAVWITREDAWHTEHVFRHVEGIQILPIK
ncbi:hypothetical protein J2Y66_003807 [Paenarthrobacter nitroguajacolicus]|nr:hypothetical protein [Paenarthrobacter nitroguajacolicus]